MSGSEPVYRSGWAMCATTGAWYHLLPLLHTRLGSRSLAIPPPTLAHWDWALGAWHHPRPTCPCWNSSQGPGTVTSWAPTLGLGPVMPLPLCGIGCLIHHAGPWAPPVWKFGGGGRGQWYILLLKEAILPLWNRILPRAPPILLEFCTGSNPELYL